MTVLTLHRKEMPRLRRGVFLLVSIAIHLGLLAAWQGETLLQIGQSDSRHTSTALHAVLAPAAEKKSTPEPAAKEPQRSERTPTVAQPAKPATSTTHTAVAPRRQAHQETEPVNTEAQNDALGRNEAAESRRAAIEKQALGRIRIELARHFHYPRQAQRLGWQGEVLLRFRLTSGGRIEAVRVARSSGYSVLDSAAVRALSDVSEIGQVMESMGGTIDLQLPIIYRLQES